jgi:hypothetical protein
MHAQGAATHVEAVKLFGWSFDLQFAAGQVNM